jgi:ABC-2 type transport system ATP-binding protein
MRICSTLEMPDRGDVRIEGQSLIEEPRFARQRIGFMPDSYGAYASTTVFEYLDFFARAYGLKGRQRARTIDRVVEFTTLGDLREKEISALSKGMKQRLCLAKTLLHDPAVMILDEPAAGLDPRARVELRELVKALAQMGKAILLSSHILTELSEMCTSVTVIERGKVRGTGAVEEVIKSVRPAVAIFVRTLAAVELVERALLERPRVTKVRRERNGLAFDFEGTDEELAQLVESFAADKFGLLELTPQALNLEDIFLSLTEGKLQ